MFAGMPIPPKLSSLIEDNHLVLNDRTKDILFLNQWLRYELSDNLHEMTMQELGIVPTHHGDTDVHMVDGQAMVTGSRHLMNQWRECTPLTAMHIRDKYRKIFFRDIIVNFLCNLN